VVSRLFPVALARGKHLFPFRTEKLSPSAPMVLGSQGPGRVGRRRFLKVPCVKRPPSGGRFALHRPACAWRAWSCGRLRRARERLSAPQRAQAHLRGVGQAPGTAGRLAPAQRPPMWMRDPAVLAPVDLPVNFAVILEQQERAGQRKRTGDALRKR
jgi:hypothetical protein